MLLPRRFRAQENSGVTDGGSLTWEWWSRGTFREYVPVRRTYLAAATIARIVIRGTQETVQDFE
jgi:hypothetical protein